MSDLYIKRKRTKNGAEERARTHHKVRRRGNSEEQMIEGKKELTRGKRIRKAFSDGCVLVLVRTKTKGGQRNGQSVLRKRD